MGLASPIFFNKNLQLFKNLINFASLLRPKPLWSPDKAKW